MVTLKDVTLYKDKLDAHKVHGVLLVRYMIMVFLVISKWPVAISKQPNNISGHLKDLPI